MDQSVDEVNKVFLLSLPNHIRSKYIRKGGVLQGIQKKKIESPESKNLDVIFFIIWGRLTFIFKFNIFLSGLIFLKIFAKRIFFQFKILLFYMACLT